MCPYCPVLQKQYDHYSLISPVHSSVIPSFSSSLRGNQRSDFFFLTQSAICGISVPQPGLETVPPAIEAQCPYLWTTREFCVDNFLAFFSGFITYLCILKLFIY